MRYRTVLIIPFLIISWAIAVARTGKPTRKQSDQRVERTTAADPKVVLSVCLGYGSITVHGWDRNQVRARSSDGLRIDFQRPAGSNTDPPREIALVTDNGSSRIGSRCLPFGDIELDIPREASVNLQAAHAEINASGVAKLSITTQDGSIVVERVTRSVDINTIGGGISIRNSKGSIKLHSVGGSIEAQDLSPSVAGDACEAGTVGGDITLNQIGHRQVKVSAVNGTLSFSGPLARGGRYSFQTISGDLSLFLPADSSFRLNATLRNEEISSDFTLKSASATAEQADILKRRGYNLKHIDAIYGTGDALINLSSFNGSIQLRKKR